MTQRMKVCNHQEYNEYLIKRGQFFSIIKEVFDKWYFTGKQKRGRPFKYSDDLIIIMHTIRHILKFPLRQIQGFFQEFVESYVNLKLTVPSYCQLSRRFGQLNLVIKDYREDTNNLSGLSIAIDSTSISIYHNSDGHGKKNRNTRKYKYYEQVRKMHVAIDCQSKMSVSMIYSSGNTTDHAGFIPVVDNITGNLLAIRADRAYDRKNCYKKAYERGAKPVIPPCRPAVEQKNTQEYLTSRDKAIRYIKSFSSYEEGLKNWKQINIYGSRSYVETYFSRFKGIFGFHLSNKLEKNRQNELIIKSNILNRYTCIGMPKFTLVT